jgi:Fur family transcriptional regulator, peroxide stress response regulator
MKDITIQEMGLTKQREVVLQVIRDSCGHLTANEVFDAAKQLLPSISFATVYNSLRFLKEAGHIAEIQFGNGASRFDRITSRHDHAICIKCGTLADIEMEHPKRLVETAARISNFEPLSLEFTLRGYCPECLVKT